ncbi:hypothetical protein SVAN01_10936 [Stagonosporopsis vannaccii]|nr:hypothetical protein SVAN01_10936 [Stagonosporopsis vannaccii]
MQWRHRRVCPSPPRYQQVTARPLLPFAHRGRPRRRRQRPIVPAPVPGLAPVPTSGVRRSPPLPRLLPLGCSAARKSLVCWGVDRAARYQLACSLVHWCCSCPGQGRAANPWWLRRPGSSDLQSTSRHSDCPNSRGPAPHLRYRSSTLSPPPCLSPTLSGPPPASGPF